MPTDAAPIPPELAVDVEPFTLTQLDEALHAADVIGCPVDELDGADPQYGPAVRWRPATDSGVEWAFRHLAEANAELARLEAQAADWASRIQAWFEPKAAPLTARARRFSAMLERYGVEERRRNPKVATLRWPSGTISTTVTKAKVGIENGETVVEWAEHRLSVADYERVVRTVKSPLVSELRKVVEMVEVPTAVGLSCGCSMTVPHLPRPADAASLMLGSAVRCPQCADDALVGSWMRTVLLVVLAGVVVPGAVVEPETITARPVPS